MNHECRVMNRTTTSSAAARLRLPTIHALQRVITQQLFNQIHVTHHHASAAVAIEPERVERVAFAVVGLEQVEVGVPLVPDHLAAREAAHGDNHRALIHVGRSPVVHAASADVRARVRRRVRRDAARSRAFAIDSRVDCRSLGRV